MRVPYSWLKEYVEVPWSPSELAERLSLAGVKVEAVHRLDFGLEGVVAARILSVADHPDAHGLRVLVLDAGGGRRHQVVTGAPGLSTGDLVPLARPGARLPGGGEVGEAAFQVAGHPGRRPHSRLPGGRGVEEAVFRGVASEGMVCSLTELATGHPPAAGEGVLRLPPETTPGEPAGSWLDAGEEEWVLELELTVNYAMFCQSLAGVAREIAAMQGTRWQAPEPGVAEEGTPVEAWTRVDLTAPDLCPRYVARVFHDLIPGPSPAWMQRRLVAAGYRPISSVVDITNYVLVELGQPMHAFDRDRLAEGRIVVRRARAGEELVTLDGVTRRLDEEMLVIADARAAVGLAGIMGGEASEVGPSTRVVVLESAHFNPLAVRRASLRLGLRTEASGRFEKWVDPGGAARAADRAAELLVDLGAGKVAPGRLDLCPRPVLARTVRMSVSGVNALLGLDLPADRATGYLTNLGFAVSPAHQVLREECPPAGDAYVVTVPSWRGDVAIEADLAEEVARSHGYNAVPATLPRGALTHGRRPRLRAAVEGVAGILVACGLDEIMTTPFVSPGAFDRLRLAVGDPRRNGLALANPLSEDQALLRTTLLAGLLEAMAHNAGHRQLDLGLFELAAVFRPRCDLAGMDAGELLAAGGDLSPWVGEEINLSLGLMGRRLPVHWRDGGRGADFFELKGLVEVLAERLGWEEVEWEPSDHPTLHPARQARLLVAGAVTGVLGELHPAVREAHGLEQAAVGELELGSLLARENGAGYRPPPRYPAILRDISLLVEATTGAGAVKDVIRRAAGPLLEKLTLFDVYRGEKIPPGTRSLAYSLVYRAPDRTLTDEEVSAIHQRVREALVRELGAGLR
ncbi:MAG: phenylalanine--tRNA ligase subunit beta [bacterium]|nr:phenylalanine--tRNA ligase subunit beta [bacterium]